MIPGERRVRMQLATAARALAASTACAVATLSARHEAGYIITPEDVPATRLHPEDLVYLGYDWTHGGGQRPPASSWRLHRALHLRRTQMQAVALVQSPHAAALAATRRGIPAFHVLVAKAGGSDIRCAQVPDPRADAHSEVLAALEDRRACLLAHSGALALGETIEAAIALAQTVEFLAHAYLVASRVAEPPLLDADEMRRLLSPTVQVPR